MKVASMDGPEELGGPFHFWIRITCASGHTQTIEVEGCSKEWAEDFASLLDGTSKFFIHPPGPDSLLSKCGRCGATVRCQVTEQPPIQTIRPEGVEPPGKVGAPGE